MKRIWVPLAIGLVVLSGCANHYVVKMNNGVQITVPNKPKLVHGAYRYKDSNGKEWAVPADRVREIEPASMAKEEQSTFTPVVHKQHHWYLLWLG